ncbi:ATP-binding protein [Kordia sp.]|uniref:tetratricopeptide repeat-containing sensor histidine kinase n=1 Tax=Kordia sp. TaxID=1965332 RepID=UPI003B5CBAD8
MQKRNSQIKFYDSKAYDAAKAGKYDSAIFFTRKMLVTAKKENNIQEIKKTYFKLSRYYNKLEKYDSAIVANNKVLRILESEFDTLSVAKRRNLNGTYYKKIDSFETAYENYTKSKELYLIKGDTINAGKVLLNIANLQKQNGNFGASQLSALDGLDYLKDSGHIRNIAGLYNALSVVSKETDKLKAAEEYINKAIELAKDSISIRKIGKKNITTFKNTKANIFKESEQYDKAIEIYKDLLNDKGNDILENKRINTNLAYTLFLKNGFNKTSDSLLRNSLSYFYSKENLSAIYSAQLKLAELYQDKDVLQYSKYIDLAAESAKKLGNLTSVYEVMEVKLRSDYSREDFDRYVALGRQLETKEEDLNHFYIYERYNYDKAEKAKITALNKARESKIRFLILLLTVIVLLVLIFFIYQKIKRRHKIEKVKTVHSTEARISSKVHDELANDIHNLMAQLETSDPDKDIVLDKLDTIYNNARDISKQNRSVETGEAFVDELNNLFRSYQSEAVNVLLKRYDVSIWNGISSHIKVTIYRVLQELLTNMKKHSNAGLVVVSIEKENKQLFIQYIDNGKGFTEEISKNGLQNAENRIQAIQGKLTFDTELHKGCKFSINVPV